MTSYVAEVGRGVDVLGTASATYVVTLTGAVPVGDTLVLAVNTTVGSSGGQTAISAVDSKGNTWTQRLFENVYSAGNPSANGNLAVLTCKVTTALTTSDTVTITSASATVAKWVAMIEQFTGVDSYDTQAAAQASSSAVASGTVTGAQANQLIVGAAAWTDASGTANLTITAPTGATAATKGSTYPINGSGPRALQVWWAETSTAGSRSATATLSASQAWGASVATFNLTAAAPAYIQYILVDGAWVPATRTVL